VLTNPLAVEKVLRDLYADSRKRILADRLMYGTDWTMILPQANVDKYLLQFIDVMDQVQGASVARTSNGSSLVDAFFGRNAVRFLGLAPGKRNRFRLEQFYGRRKISSPDWLGKVA
jgi:predicted TIM-barrel fold metal-dependent hydrolase